MRNWITLIESPQSEIVLWHGTPHEFADFKTEHLGAGEGNQAYGWGLYFAQNRRVGSYYQKKLTSVVKFRNQVVNPTDSGTVPRVAERMLSDDVGAAEAIKLETEEAVEYLEWARDLRREMVEEQIEQLRALSPSEFAIDRVKQGNLFEVVIPNGPFLFWDKSFKEQSPTTKKILRAMSAQYPKENLRASILDDDSGKIIYAVLGNYYRNVARAGNEYQQASLDLSRAGILGMAYPDGYSREGKGETETYNYVIFSGSSVTIRKQHAE